MRRCAWTTRRCLGLAGEVENMATSRWNQLLGSYRGARKEANKARLSADVAFARAFLSSQGSDEERRAEARIATEGLERRAKDAEMEAECYMLQLHAEAQAQG